MSRNRMKHSQSLHWMSVLKWIMITGLLSGLGLSYMLCKNQNLHLAAETLKLQAQLDGIEDRNAELALDLEGMKSMKLLQRRLVEMHSTLVYWGDPRANWVSGMEQNTRARLVKMGTMPKQTLNLDIPPPTADATPLQPTQ
jgi:hypothetical protein